MAFRAGAEVSIAYAAKHPERVTRMVLYAASTDNRPDPSLTPDQQKMYEAAYTLISNGWSQGAIRESFALSLV